MSEKITNLTELASISSGTTYYWTLVDLSEPVDSVDRNKRVTKETMSAYFAASGSNILETTVTLNQDDILTMGFGGEKEMIPAPGAGKVIELISSTPTMIFDTAPFGSATIFRFVQDGSSDILMATSSSFMAATAKRTEQMTHNTAAIELLENTALMAQTAGTPTGGGSGSQVVTRIAYRILDV